MLTHIVAIPMTGVGLHGGFRGNAWYAHRIDIFKRFTLKSLANQSNRNFILWMWFRPEEEFNSLTLQLAKAIASEGLQFVFTFNGLMYWDDKFSNYTLRTKLRNLLMMLYDCWWYKEWKSRSYRCSYRGIWKYTWENKNKKLQVRLARSLFHLTKFLKEKSDWVYLTRIDSDDMFHREAVRCIQDQEPEAGKALVFDKGYIYNVHTGQVADWNPPTNPPFHTIIFPSETFFDPVKHLEYYGSFKSHEDIPKVFNAVTLDINKYCVSFHGKHISTAWDSPLLRKGYYLLKYGSSSPFKGYCYTTSGRNISTHWQSRARKKKNVMIGKEYGLDEGDKILSGFGIKGDR